MNALKRLLELKKKTQASVYPLYLSIGNLGNYHNDKLVQVVRSGLSPHSPNNDYFHYSLKLRDRPHVNSTSPLVGCNLYMPYVKESLMKKTYPNLTQQLTALPSLVDTVLLDDFRKEEKEEATDYCRGLLKDAHEALAHCRNWHRHSDRKSVRLEFTLATTLPAKSDWMDAFLQDSEFDLASFVKVADSYDMYAFVDRFYQEHFVPVERLLSVGEGRIPMVDHLGPEERTSLVFHAEVLSRFFGPLYCKSPIIENLRRRAGSLEPVHVPLNCLRPSQNGAKETLGLLYGLDPTLYPTGSAAVRPPSILPRSRRPMTTTVSYNKNVRQKYRFKEALLYARNLLHRFFVLGEEAATTTDEDRVVSRFAVAPPNMLASLSRETRQDLLHMICKVVWEMYFLDWTTRINNSLRRKGVDVLVRLPRNTTDLAALSRRQKNHVRVVVAGDRGTNVSELDPVDNGGKFVLREDTAIYVFLAMVAKKRR